MCGSARPSPPPAACTATPWWCRERGSARGWTAGRPNGDIYRAGLVATNSIRGGTNRVVLDRILKDSTIFDAWADEPWVVEGAAVRVSLICFAPSDSGLPTALNGAEALRINADLTTGQSDLTTARALTRNVGVAFMGDIKRGPFDIPGNLARDWLQLPANPNGCPNADVLRPWANGMDLTRRPSGKWIVDFGYTMSEGQAALYEAPFTYISEHVRPIRQKNREQASREFWFRHWNPRPRMWRALDGLSRYIATPTLAKHRLFSACTVPLDIRQETELPSSCRLPRGDKGREIKC